MIKIQDYDKEKQKLSFITDMSISLANAIRRSVLEIPTLAIDEVEINQNDSALYDEILAHRIGLVPIKTEKTLKEIKFRLKEKGPKTVYSTDLKPSVGTDYKLPLVILDNEQEIQLVATCRPGIGIEHIKHSPGLIYYRHNVDDDVLDFIIIDDEGKISYDEKDLREREVPENIISKIKKINKVEELKFTIEAWGQIEVKKIFPEAINVLDENLNELSKAIK
jgi:DNA-directed RNA polymerase subunit D